MQTIHTYTHTRKIKMLKYYTFKYKNAVELTYSI